MGSAGVRRDILSSFGGAINETAALAAAATFPCFDSLSLDLNDFLTATVAMVLSASESPPAAALSDSYDKRFKLSLKLNSKLI